MLYVLTGRGGIMTTTIYGIPNCGMVKKARVWLGSHGIDYAFHDYKKEGVTADRLQMWASETGWEALLNRSGTTFRKLPESAKSGLDLPKALALMVEQPSMIRRPVVEHGGKLLVGFKEAEWEDAFGQ
jgi:Spx/MgsR family transcriptional regulator